MIASNSFQSTDIAHLIQIALTPIFLISVSMLALAGALLTFLIEVRIATNALRIGIEEVSREDS